MSNGKTKMNRKQKAEALGFEPAIEAPKKKKVSKPTKPYGFGITKPA
tara:strand:- start:255 stop:395 length:141 start_codon:yes stop_codon:yes gene_type:complete